MFFTTKYFYYTVYKTSIIEPSQKFVGANNTQPKVTNYPNNKIILYTKELAFLQKFHTL